MEKYKLIRDTKDNSLFISGPDFDVTKYPYLELKCEGSFQYCHNMSMTLQEEDELVEYQEKMIEKRSK
jgi:hypothetical protein